VSTPGDVAALLASTVGWIWFAVFFLFGHLLWHVDGKADEKELRVLMVLATAAVLCFSFGWYEDWYSLTGLAGLNVALLLDGWRKNWPILVPTVLLWLTYTLLRLVEVLAPYYS